VAQGVPDRHYKGVRSSAKGTGRLYPRRNPWYSLSKAESGVPRKKSPVTPPGIDPGTSRLVTQCLNHYATAGPNLVLYLTELTLETATEIMYRLLGNFIFIK